MSFRSKCHGQIRRCQLFQLKGSWPIKLKVLVISKFDDFIFWNIKICVSQPLMINLNFLRSTSHKIYPHYIMVSQPLIHFLFPSFLIFIIFLRETRGKRCFSQKTSLLNTPPPKKNKKKKKKKKKKKLSLHIKYGTFY